MAVHVDAFSSEEGIQKIQCNRRQICGTWRTLSD